MELWQIQLLGGLRLNRGDIVVERFRTQKTGALLGFLAYYPKPHRRETLIDLLWPELTLAQGRNNLSVSLSYLRRILEPEGVEGAPSMLVADRMTVGLRKEAFTTDVQQFNKALQDAKQAGTNKRRVHYLMAAIQAYGGDLLSGHGESWIVPEAQHIEELYFHALQSLITDLCDSNNLSLALEYAQRGVAMDPLREELHQQLMSLYLEMEMPLQAVRQYQRLKRLLVKKLNVLPQAGSEQLLKAARKAAATTSDKKPAAAIINETSSKANNLDPTGRKLPLTPAETAVGSIPRLPLQWTRFFGRETEIAQLQELLFRPGGQLVTVTGPGGSGKTRLAIEATRHIIEIDGISTWFVPLSGLTDSRFLANTIFDGLRLRRLPTMALEDQIAAHLAAQPTLLVLDTFEHLIEGGSGLIRTLLAQAPGLKILVTSRNLLHLAGEQELALAPLPLPEGDKALEEIVENVAVQLFWDRAQGVQPRFKITRHNAAAVSALCRRLDGLPLALELAASRVTTLSPVQILQHLKAGTRVLSTRSGTVEERHASLNAALDWSYHLLTPALQRFFTYLFVLHGEWELEAAQSVTGAVDTLDFLDELCNCSLVVRHKQQGHGRFRLLDTLREFARQQLSPDEQQAVAKRHCAYYASFAANSHRDKDDQAARLSRLEVERDNLRAALNWALEHEPTTALQIAVDLAFFWEARGYLEEGQQGLLTALERATEAPVTLRCDALNTAARLLFFLGNMAETERLCQQSLALSRSARYSRGQSAAQLQLAIAADFRNEGEIARGYLQQSLNTYREIGDKAGIAAALLYLGINALSINKVEAASEYLTESLELWRALDDRSNLAMCLFYVAHATSDAGNLEEAQAVFTECIAVAREANDIIPESYAYWGLGQVTRRLGNYDDAASNYKEALHKVRGMKHLWGMAFVFEGSGYLNVDVGQPERAATLLGCAESLRAAIGFPQSRAYHREHTDYLSRLQQHLEATHYQEFWQRGTAMSWEEGAEIVLQM